MHILEVLVRRAAALLSSLSGPSMAGQWARVTIAQRGRRCCLQVDVLPMPDGTKAAGVSYFREGASFFGSPVSPMGPVSQ